MNYNLIAAAFWFVIGVALLVASWTLGDAMPFQLRFLPISPGWLGLVLCVYNVVRWWSGKRPRQDPLKATLEARRRSHRAHEPPQGTPDPTFNFTDPPPAPAPPLPALPPRRGRVGVGGRRRTDRERRLTFGMKKVGFEAGV